MQEVVRSDCLEVCYRPPYATQPHEWLAM